jgi:hypothetical protein
MLSTEVPKATPRGLYRDVLRNASGRLSWESPWRRNVIVDDCRRLLASFMHGAPPAAGGIAGLRVGAGLAAWDITPPPSPPSTVTQLADPQPFAVPPANLAINYLELATDVVSATPTSRIQVVATLGPGVPPWPDANHATITLREFGLFGTLGGADVLVNYRIHPAIAKDPTSTLVRTIWLVF